MSFSLSDVTTADYNIVSTIAYEYDNMSHPVAIDVDSDNVEDMIVELLDYLNNESEETSRDFEVLHINATVERISVRILGKFHARYMPLFENTARVAYINKRGHFNVLIEILAERR